MTLTEIEESFERVEKRPFDRFLLAPFLVWVGLEAKELPSLARTMVVSAGLYQALYAWKEYRMLASAINENKLDEAIAIWNNHDNI